MLERCQTNPFQPIRWMKDHPGMQGKDYFTPEDTYTGEYQVIGAEPFNTIKQIEISWLRARDAAIKEAKHLSELGVTKQFVNRLLEPFMWHTVIATGTDWENFFSLRAHEAAEIHIQDLAHKMLEAYNAGTPKQLQPGEWHIPFGDQIEVARIPGFNDTHYVGWLEEQKTKIATARCARISYNTFEGKDDYEADIKLHDRLASSGHWSPFEHCAKAMSDDEFKYYLGNTSFIRESDTKSRISRERGWCGNFRGFIQYRKLFNQENRTDARVQKTPGEPITNTEHREALREA